MLLFCRRGGGDAAASVMMAVRHFSRKRAENVRKINPKVPREEAKAISNGLYQIIKDHGPLTVSNTWNLAKAAAYKFYLKQEAGVNGLSSKTHMKIMLKWMRGREMLKLFCTHQGSSKKFFVSTLPEEPQPLQGSSPAPALDTQKPSLQQKKHK
ncbi:hypothetical protein J5N97_018986 [Dioscorea zingiberensis]|uniref:Uncharacterized protein n=1 Tax=Dioscorea zingiberensis TaxID=325984 RepID=A0A9D5HC99_9LILI|nr:hypothetical protein J5N97_018986 [Dioscorea zingiberensis]